MRAPKFWTQPHITPLARALSPLGALYGAVSAWRLSKPGVKLPVPVICIGNFTLGGAGKTPTAVWLAQALIKAGHKPMFVSRGYGGKLSGMVPVAVNRERHTADLVGDEPLLLARIAPAFICADRLAGAKAAIKAGASVIILDDGLQNPSLFKSFSLAVVDGETGLGNGLCFPAGPLRAPISAQWPKVQALVSIGGGSAQAAVLSQSAAHGIPGFTARLVPDAALSAAISGQNVFAFAGIGRPEKFYATVRSTGAHIVAVQSFPDHHRFSKSDLTALAEIAKSRGIIPVTTEKDAMRLPSDMRANVVALPVTLQIDGEASLLKLVVSQISGSK